MRSGPKKGAGGRLKADLSDKVRQKLFELLEENYDAIFQDKGPPKNLKCLLSEINECLKLAVIEERGKVRMLERRAIQKLLKKYYTIGAVKKKREGKNVYYYYNKNFPPAFFWLNTLKPFIDGMKKEDGGRDWDSPLLLKSKDHDFLLKTKIAILEDGLHITDPIDWLKEDARRDIWSSILNSINRIVINEIRLRLGPWVNDQDDKNLSINQQKLKKYFKGKKLAIVYVLDGSDFKAHERVELGKFPFSDEENEQAEKIKKDSRFRLPR